MCTGAGTAEAARAVLQKTINDSGLVNWQMSIDTVANWDRALKQSVFQSHQHAFDDAWF